MVTAVRGTFAPQRADNVTKVGILTAATDYVGPYRYRRADDVKPTLTMVLSGTWVGTVLVQASIPDIGQWVTLATYVDNACEPMTMDGSLDLRIYCSAYTSGTCHAGIINQ
jgi:hypothetical protein